MSEASALDSALRDRALGAFLGLAVGDALGTTLEFSERDEFPHHTEMTGGGPFRLAPGQWTDDTSMALALADSLVSRGAFDPADLMRRFLAWYREGAYSCTGTCFDIGGATASALRRFEETGEPFAGSTSEGQAGNGSIMRLAPAVLFPLHDEEAAIRLAAAQGRTTHGAPQAVEGCMILARMLHRAIRGVPGPFAPVPDWPGHPEIAALAAGSWRGKAREDISASGYVVHTLEAALWAVEATDTFEDALVLAVNLGEDADSVGAVAGQLAGALYGASAIPERWLAPLAWRDRIEGWAERLVGWMDARQGV